MPRKLSLGRTGSKHKNKKPKVEAEEEEEEEEVVVPPRELVFDQDEIDDEVRRVVRRLVEQVRREQKDRWFDAWIDLREAAREHNQMQDSVLSLEPRLQGLALAWPYRRWRVCVKALLDASGRQLRPEQTCVGLGWCQLWQSDCFCKEKKPCPECGMPKRDTVICWLRERIECECGPWERKSPTSPPQNSG